MTIDVSRHSVGKRWGQTGVLLVSATAVAVIGAAPSWASLSGMGWGACPAGETATSPDGTKAKCTTISVPIDYQDPSQGFFELLVTALLPADPDAAKNVILTNRGGPGGDMTGFLDSKSFPAPAEFYKNNALIAIQPRGLAGSTPLHCDTAAACNEYIAQHPEYLPSLSTENIARDMDTFRKLAELDKIDYYGASWGTELGAEYATLFPEHTDEMVLDSAMDPNAPVGLGGGGDQIRAFDKRLYQWFDFVAERDDKYQLGDTPLKVFNAWNKAMDAADAEAGNTKNFFDNLGLASIADPRGHYLPPAAQVNDLPPFLRPLSAVALPVYNLVNQGWARVSYVVSHALGTAELAVALPFLPFIAKGAGTNYQTVSTAEPTTTATNIQKGATTNMYSRGGWEIYADQVSQMINQGAPDSAFPTKSSSVGADENLASSLMGPAVAVNNVKAAYSGRLHVEHLVPALAALVKVEFHNLFGSSTATTTAALRDATGHFQKFWGYTKTPGFTGETLDTKPLVLQSDDDPATPSPGGHEMAKALDADLVTVEGGDHGVFRRHNDTVDHAVLEYFDTGKTGLVRSKEAPLPSEIKAAQTTTEQDTTTTSTQTLTPAATTNLKTTTTSKATTTTTDKTTTTTSTTAATTAGKTATSTTAATTSKTATTSTTAGVTTASKTATSTTTTATTTAGKTATTSTTAATTTAGKTAISTTTATTTAGKTATTSTTAGATTGKTATTSTATGSQSATSKTTASKTADSKTADSSSQ